MSRAAATKKFQVITYAAAAELLRQELDRSVPVLTFPTEMGGFTFLGAEVLETCLPTAFHELVYQYAQRKGLVIS
jgi:hypothetical protein